MPAAAHPPTHVLAELLAEVLDTSTTADVQAHVGQCAVCQQVMSEIGQVTSALGSLPAELPLSEHVATRLMAALDAEGASRQAELAGDGGNVAWFRRRLPQALAAAASVSVIGLAGYIAVDSGDQSGNDASTLAEGTNDSAGAADSAPGDDDLVPPAIAGDNATTFGLEQERDIQSTIGDVWRAPTEVVSGCGQQLSRDLGKPLIGSTALDSSVLVVVEDPTAGRLDGWLLPTCDAGPEQAIGSPVSIQVPDEP